MMQVSNQEIKEIEKLLKKERRKKQRLYLASFDSFMQWLKTVSYYLYEALLIAKTVLEIYNTLRKLFR